MRTIPAIMNLIMKYIEAIWILNIIIFLFRWRIFRQWVLRKFARTDMPPALFNQNHAFNLDAEFHENINFTRSVKLGTRTGYVTVPGGRNMIFDIEDGGFSFSGGIFLRSCTTMWLAYKKILLKRKILWPKLQNLSTK